MYQVRCAFYEKQDEIEGYGFFEWGTGGGETRLASAHEVWIKPVDWPEDAHAWILRQSSYLCHRIAANLDEALF
jgi:hypothetical protein